MNITVFGSGYVGLVQGAVLAGAGHHVMCVDIDAVKIAQLKQGKLPIFEPGLERLVQEGLDNSRLEFTTNASLAVKHGVIQFIAVGTPSDEDGSADLKYVLQVAETIALYMDHYKVIVTKSTVPVGTADLIENSVKESCKRRGIVCEFDVVSNPEFLKEGAAVVDCQQPDRIIIGTNSSKAETLLRELYSSFNLNDHQWIVMDTRSAELTKYAANCMLATKISFMNEMANLAELLGADIESVRQGIGSDQRIGPLFIAPGLGYGGSCFPKDVRALIHSAESLGFDTKIIKAVEARNQEQKSVLFKKIHHYFNGNLKDKTIALWGLSFKPNTDDMREASSRVLMEALWQAGAKVKAFDPVAMHEARRLYAGQDQLQLCDTKEDALTDANALAIVTEHQEFRAPNFALMKSLLKQAVIFDGRNLYSILETRQKGFVYMSIGRGRPFQPRSATVVIN